MEQAESADGNCERRKLKPVPKIFDHSGEEFTCNESSATVYMRWQGVTVCYVELLVWEYKSVEARALV